jgi:hypothetical protein
MQLNFGPRRLQVFAVASLLLVLYANSALVAHADDSQQPVDCGSGLSYDQCQSAQDSAQAAPVVDQNNQTSYGGENATYYG